MDTIIVATLAVLVGLGTGALGGYFGRRIVSGRRYETARLEASQVLDEARESRRSLLLEAKEEALKVRSAGEPELRERLMEMHAKVGPLSQLNDLVVIAQFDVRDRIGTLRPPLLLIRGLDDPGMPPEYELEIHDAVPGSRYLKLRDAGHFPMAERPQEVNQAIEELLKSSSRML